VGAQGEGLEEQVPVKIPTAQTTPPLRLAAVHTPHVTVLLEHRGTGQCWVVVVAVGAAA